MTSIEPEWLTLMQVSERISVPITTVISLVKDHELTVQDGKISLESVQALLAEGKQIPPPTSAP